MENSFKYTTPEQQLKKLQSQHLRIDDEAAAKNTLNTYGYYNIINGYREPYITREYNKKHTALMSVLNKYFLFFLLIITFGMLFYCL